MLAFPFSRLSTCWRSALRFRPPCTPRESYRIYRVFSPWQWHSTTCRNYCQSSENEKVEHSATNNSENPEVSQFQQRSWSLLLGTSTLPDESAIISKFEISKLPIQHGITPLLLLLITPSCIELIRDGGSFIPELLRRMFKEIKPDQKFDVTTAVVDQIPYPLIDELSARDMFGDQHLHGCEGISVVISDSEIVAPDLWSPRKRTQKQQSTAIPQPSVVSFKIGYRLTNTLVSGRSLLPQTSRTFQLPIANTLFRNGRLSTLFASRWVLVPMSESKLDLVCTEKTNLTQQTFNLVAIAKSNALHPRVGLSHNLKQITIPRVVAAALGNIVRRVFAGKNQEEIPASKDLEEAADRIIDAGRSNKRIAVWALVTPRECRTHRPTVKAQRLQDRIESGSRLHKVLSGGGGWGAKEGLLALDPNSQYVDDQDEMQQIFGDSEDINREMAQAFGEVIKPGDVIAFYIHRGLNKHKEKSSVDPKPHRIRSWVVNIQPSNHFGTLPSSTETHGSFDAASGEKNQAFDFIFIKNHFGMLSEHGMSLKIDTYGPPESAEPSGSVVTTKIDPPFSYFSSAKIERSLKAPIHAKVTATRIPPPKKT